MLEWRRRREPSMAMLWLSPLIAIGLTMLAGMLVFTAMGYDGFHAVGSIFVTPFVESQRWADIGVKAAPLVMIALGLAIGFRANVWNIGAEGQYVMGAVAGTGVALLTYDMTGWWILPAMALAGILGGMAWAAIPALLRVKLQVSEILTSLMLTYVAVQLLYYLVRGPWKDPGGFNFPQTRMFTADQTLPAVMEGSLVHIGIPAALVIAVVAWLLMEKTTAGYAVKVVGLAPAAARHGGFSAARTTWATMLLGGGLAGLAGLFEAAGPFGQLTPQFPVGYGFTAIIVAFLGRLNPLGIVFGGIVLAGTYVGGEIAQSTVRLPQAATGLFQAMLLFILLATDVLVKWRLVRKRRAA
ncbi:MAG: ABC transporter permease [Bosea sp.]|uniref:ABC transporter permease n=1 Tax=unclassified Bosea (in: a-proteobacteria) TaxID=2653178 RepID=UPI000969B22B|nr:MULTISPECIES: ABC transporter permease [unclassified Bosea (in: a-proteobacteria)]MBN9456728.1 ABC transporter permease [Bosea sp. (in: a-proteobacteria)]OJV08948.1 MAG: sugar ABC transporter permease [Bosea sp. 67-29]